MTGTIELRDYQRRDVGAIFAAWRQHRSIVYVLPTAGGKTVVAARVIQQEVRAGRRVLIVAHRWELIRQMRDTLVDDGLNEKAIGLIIAGEEPRTDAPIQVASIQTLNRRTKPAADVVIIDEAHHATARSYTNILSWYREARWLGLTATPSRLDGKPLGDVFEFMVAGAKPSELVEAGWLRKPRVFTKKHGKLVDLRKIKIIGGDFHQGQLAKRVNRKTLNGDIVEHWRELAAERRTVVFAVTVAHAEKIAAAFRAAGIQAEVVTGKTPAGVRRDILGPGGRLDRGVTRVVVTCMLITEGWDLPSVKCIVMARPTKSTALCLQMAGRALRPFVEKRGRLKGLDVPPLILDHAGNALVHGLPHVDRIWSLTERLKSGGGAAPTRSCPDCGAVVTTSPCEECGATVSFGRNLPQERRAEKLVEVEPISPAERERIVAMVQRTATEKGADGSWVEAVVRTILGEAA